MSLFYQIAYRLGFAPWEAAGSHPAAADHVASLLDRETSARSRPGVALDVGCGRGHWSVALARRGWRVTGIDTVGRALAGARRRAQTEGVAVDYVEGDVAALAAAGIAGPFDLVFDFGTLHGLGPLEFAAAGREVTAVAGSGSTLLMLAWSPGRRGPLPRGVAQREIERAFADWRIEGTEAFDATGLPPPLRSVAPPIWRLRRQ